MDKGDSEILLNLQENAVNNLKAKQREKIKELKNRMSDVLGPSYHEYYFLKWLKARNFDVSAAETMLRASLKWRAENRINTLLDDFVSPEVLNKYFPFGSFTVDKEGNTLWLMPLGRIDIYGILYSISKSDVMKYLICTFETAVREQKARSEKANKLIDRITVIIDLTDFDIRWALWKPCFDVLLSYLRMYESNYPESLHKGFIINAPKIFTMFYTMIKPFMGEETRKKIGIYGKSGWQDDILEYVDKDQLPKLYGGNLVGKDGNEFCTPQICMGGPVPKSYHMLGFESSFLKKDTKTKNLNAREIFTVDFNVEKVNSTLTWAFKTEEHDISFGISLAPLNATDSKQKDKNYVVPIDRTNSHLVAEEGTIVCTEVGKYSLHFDNSFSWYRSKKLSYNARVEEPE